MPEKSSTLYKNTTKSSAQQCKLHIASINRKLLCVQSSRNIKYINQEKNQSIETNREMTETMEFADKDFKTSLINLTKKLKDIKESLT